MPIPSSAKPRAPIRIAFLGFTGFERSALSSFFRLAGERTPAYVRAQMLSEAEYLIADADHPPSVQLVAATERMSETVFIGAAPPEGALAWMARPIDALHVMRELDALVALNGSFDIDIDRVAPSAAPADAPIAEHVVEPGAAAPPAPPAAPDSPPPDLPPITLLEVPAAVYPGATPAAPAAASPIVAAQMPPAPAPPDAAAARPPARAPRPPARPRAPSRGAARTATPPPPGAPAAATASAAAPAAAPAPAPAPAAASAAAAAAVSAPAPAPASITAPAATGTPAPDATPDFTAAAPLPAADPAPLSPLLSRSQAEAPPAAPQALLVDDSEIALRFLETRLKPWGLHVDRAGSSTQAAELLLRRNYDFVFLDVELGDGSELDGLELCQQIKHTPATLNAIVVLVSAHHSELDRVRGALAGCDAYLGKPLDADELARLLQRQGLKAPARTPAAH